MHDENYSLFLEIDLTLRIIPFFLVNIGAACCRKPSVFIIRGGADREI